MSSRLIAAPALALALVACGEDPRPTGKATVEVLAYDYELDLATRAVTSTLELRLVTPGNCVELPTRVTEVDTTTVVIDDKPAAAAFADGVTMTACGDGWDAGTTLSLTTHLTVPLDTWRPSQVGYSVTDDAGDQPMSYLLSWIGQCDRLGPCDPTPGLFARYRFTVHHPSGTTALCPGRITATPELTTCEFDYDGGPTYSTFGVIASPAWDVLSKGTWGGVNVTLYDRPGTGLATLVDPSYHQAFFESMVQRFGAFPYGTELRIASGPTYWSGFEHPGNIVLDEALGQPGASLYTRPANHVLNHELAHQWAGDQTTIADTYDFVWKEAMAEYLAFVYEDETEPAVGLATARAWKQFAVGAGYFPVPEDEPRPTLLQYYGEVYGPGPMILFRQLEALSSRAAVITALQQVLGQPRALSVAEVLAALETSTGLDLDQYADVWIRGSGRPTWPSFRVTVNGTEPAQTVTVEETTAGGQLHGCNFSIGLLGASGESAKAWIERGVDGVASVTVPTGVTWRVTTTILDIDAQCLAFNATTAAPAPRHPDGWSPWRTATLIP